MKKYKNLLSVSSMMLLLGIMNIILVLYLYLGERQNQLIGIGSLLLLAAWALGSVLLLLIKVKRGKAISKLLIAGNVIALCTLTVFGCLSLLAANHGYTSDFSITSSLFDSKNIMIVVPHQDDDINLMGGLIEQYTQGNSEVTVVFATNGDGDLGGAEVRAAEVISVLTTLGVKKENIYYLGYGDLWEPQVFDGKEIRHIYNSADPDAVWTSLSGATATYGTESIPCYLDLPYTRNSYLHSMQSILQEKRPDIIFAVDFDAHADHRATDLFFEEALCNVLKTHPDYHPTVYKGFCYGTAWKAESDYYDDLNLLSSKKPDDYTWNSISFGYEWEDRVRFPVSATNLNVLLMNNSVYQSLSDYSSQFAYIRAESVLNGDKVFWERRTDSLLYNAEITVGGEASSLLNDFKLKDSTDIFSGTDASGVAFLSSGTVQITLRDVVTANCIYLYDNPNESENILAGHLTFNDGTTIEFGELNKDGSATIISFPEKQIQWFEIVPTETEGSHPGLSEIELYHDTPAAPKDHDSFLMAVDQDDNFVYDYIIHEGDAASFKLYRFPHAEQLSKEEVALSFESDAESSSYSWDNDALIVNCAKGSKCQITISAGDSVTTYTVSNPRTSARAYLTALRSVEKMSVDIRYFIFCLHQVYNRIMN